MKQNIAITGVTGHLGSNLLQSLLKKNHSVKALIRSKNVPFLHDRLEWVKGELTSKKALEALLDQSDILVHCASMISLGKTDKELVYQTNVKATEKLVDICVKNKIRLIHISSSSATASKEPSGRFDETTPYVQDQKFYYAWTKAISEKIVLKAVKKQNLDAFIIRPTAIIGPADPKPSAFGQTIWDIYKRNLRVISSGGYDLVDVRDLSSTIINSITHGVKGEIYLVGGQFVSIKKLTTIIIPDRPPLVIPVTFLIFILPIIALYDKVIGLKWPISSESLYTLKYAPENVDSSKAIKYLSHQNRPIESTLKDLISWFNQNAKV